LYLAPDLVQMGEVGEGVAADPSRSERLASVVKGERLYRMIYERIASQVVDSAA
jgi:hypothetical protein